MKAFILLLGLVLSLPAHTANLSYEIRGEQILWLVEGCYVDSNCPKGQYCHMPTGSGCNYGDCEESDWVGYCLPKEPQNEEKLLIQWSQK